MVGDVLHIGCLPFSIGVLKYRILNNLLYSPIIPQCIRKVVIAHKEQ